MADAGCKGRTILLASPFFFPEPISTAKYNTFLARKLVERGCDVVVICSHPFYPAWRVEFTEEKLEGVRILRGGRRVKYPGSTILRRLVLEAWYAWHFLKTERRLNKSVDTVVAVVPPIFFTFFISAHFRGCRKVAVVHDLLGVMAKTSSSLTRRMVAGIMQRVEAFLLRRFEHVVCLSEAMKNTLVNQYGLNAEACKVHYPFVTLAQPKADGGPLNHLFPDGFKHIVYSGALGEKQKPAALYRFFREACDYRQDLCCHIFSGGPMYETLRAENRNERIFFHDLVPEERLPDLYACSDIQVLPQAEGTGSGAFPSKLPNLFAAGVPILAICDKGSELATMVEKLEGGKVVSGWATDQLLKAIDILLGWQENNPRVERRVKAEKHIRQYFDVDRLLNLIIEKP